MRDKFGWQYPAGAEHDPRAPWNEQPPNEPAAEVVPHCDTCDGTGEVVMMVCYGGKPTETVGDCPDCKS